jgi:N-acetylmuramoyl-L-alanine amidase
MNLIISAGHGGTDPGAVSADGKLIEAHLALRLRDKVADICWAEGATVIEDGQKGENQTLPVAIGLLRSHPGARAVEFHLNAGPATATGVEALALPTNRRLAQSLAMAVSATLQLPVRGGDKGYRPQDSGQHHRLGFCVAGGVILESAFISNPADMESYLKNEAALAEAIATVLLDKAAG